MDSATQFLLGASIAGAVLAPRIGPKAVLLGGIVATLPDLDFVVPFDNPVDRLTYHRGASHSVLVLTLASPAIAWIATKIFKSAAEHWRLTFFTVWLCLVTHPMLDVLTTYGTQILWPLPVGPPAALPAVFIIDPVYTFLLLAGILTIVFARNRPGRGLRANRVLLGLSTLYLAVGITGHYIVKARAEAQPALKDSRILVQPLPFNILFWQVLAVDKTTYRTGITSPFAGCGAIALRSHPRLSAPPDGIEAGRAIARYQWFTDGFYTYGKNGKDVFVRDLRLGVNPNFIFTFVIAERQGDAVRTVKPRRIPVDRLDMSAFRTLVDDVTESLNGCPG